MKNIMSEKLTAVLMRQQTFALQMSDFSEIPKTSQTLRVFVISTLFFFIFLLVSFIPCNAKITNTSNNENLIEVPVKEGWNLLAGYPNVGNTDSLTSPDKLQSSIKSADIPYMYAFDSIKKDYFLIYPLTQEGVVNLFKERPHISNIANANSEAFSNFVAQGFWIYSKKSGVLKYVPEDMSHLNELTLSKGWNLLAITPEFTNQSFNDLKGTCIVEKAYLYTNGDKKEWKPVTLNEKLSANIAGFGIAIKVKSDCRLES